MEMGIAAGGIVEQMVVEDPGNVELDAGQTKVFSIQIPNAQHYQQVTGKLPPPSPITANIYVLWGYPFFSMDEEASTISRAFEGVQSINQLNDTNDARVYPRHMYLSSAEDVVYEKKRSCVLFDVSGPVTTFQSVMKKKEEIMEKGSMIL
jgi:hypothetical protein